MTTTFRATWLTGRRPLASVVAIALAVTTVGALGAPAESKPTGKADLKVSRVTATPPQVSGGQRVTTSVRLRNSGDKAASPTVTTYLRKKAVARPNDKVLGSKSVHRIGAHKRRDIDVPGRVPKRLAAETATSFYVVACVRRLGTKGARRCAVSKQPTELLPFTAGARTLGDKLFPQLGNGGYDASHYALDLDYDPGDGTPGGQAFLDGTSTTVEATATQPLSEFSLDFQPFEVSSVQVNGAEAGFAYADTEVLGDPDAVTQLTKLVVTPETPLADGEDFTVEVDYTGTPDKLVDVDESYEGWIQACYTPTAGAETCDGAFVVNEPNGAQTFFPSNNHPSDKATFDTTITVPTGKTAIGIGEQTGPAVDNLDGTTTWSWTEDSPSATYLTTATVGDFTVTEGTVEETSTGRTLPSFTAIDASASLAEVAAVNVTLQRSASMINFLSDAFGAYPFDSTGAVVDRTTDVNYALEVQTKPHYDTPSVGAGTHLHELAHQWFGDSATLDQWSDIWFNEGWAQWSQWSWSYEENGSPTSPAQRFTSNYTDGTKWQIAPAVLDGDPENLFATFPTYTRGAMTVEGYRQIVGDEAFYAFAKDLQADFAHDNISTQEFIDAAVAGSGLHGADLDRLRQYFQQWLYGKVKPTITGENF